MKKILDRIVPQFIHRLNDRLLKNSILGWQLQLPKILWLWTIITALIVPIAFLYPLDIFYNHDRTSVIGIAVFVAVIEFFLFGYILIQFNASKSFGKRTLLHGMKEQLAYLFIIMLCFSNIIVMPFIIDWRTSRYMSMNEIISETEVYNKARHYFMHTQGEYRYFPGAEEVNTFILKSNRNNEERDTYYKNEVEPLLAPYFKKGNLFYSIDSVYTRKSDAPQLYYIGNDFLDAYDNSDYQYNTKHYRSNYYDNMNLKNYEIQFIDKSDTERILEITAFIHLNTEYKSLSDNSERQYHTTADITFDAPEVILKKYKSNQFEPCITVYNQSNYFSSVQPSEISLNGTLINHVHKQVLHAMLYKWRDARTATLICFFIALGLSLLLFVYKNVRLREFILSFVYSALIILTIIILTIISGMRDFFPWHTAIVIFISGILFLSTAQRWPHFSSVRTILVILSNVMLPFAPFVIFHYITDYLDINILGSYTYKSTIEDFCLWGGIILYLTIGSIVYKKGYEKIYALPLHR